MVKDLAVVNLFVIFVLVFMGFGIIQVVKKRYED